jgi:O-antigen/teichoic acid export membrane protein
MAWSLGLAAGPLLRLWVGPTYAEHYHVVQVLVASFIVTAHNHAAFTVLSAMRRVGPVVWKYSMPQAILNLALSVFLVTRLGIIGVALGTLIPPWLFSTPSCRSHSARWDCE